MATIQKRAAIQPVVRKNAPMSSEQAENDDVGNALNAQTRTPPALEHETSTRADEANEKFKKFGAGESYRRVGVQRRGGGSVASRFPGAMEVKLSVAKVVKELDELKASGKVGTAVLNSGIQMSGVLTDVRSNENQEPIFMKFTGPTQLSVDGKEIEGQGGDHHKGGYSSPIGPLVSGALLSEQDASGLKALGIIPGERVVDLEFASGIKVSGKCEGMGPDENAPLILGFSDCTVTYGDEMLFMLDWGMFDMVVGESVASVDDGPADRLAYRVVNPEGLA